MSDIFGSNPLPISGSPNGGQGNTATNDPQVTVQRAVIKIRPQPPVEQAEAASRDTPRGDAGARQTTEERQDRSPASERPRTVERSTTERPESTPRAQSNTEQNVRIVEGEVIESSPREGRYIVRTDEGDIVLRVDTARQTPPQVGTIVALDIPDDAQIQQTLVRIYTETPQQQQPSVRASETPVELIIQPPRVNGETPAVQTVTVNQTVNLESIPAEQAAIILEQISALTPTHVTNLQPTQTLADTLPPTLLTTPLTTPQASFLPSISSINTAPPLTAINVLTGQEPPANTAALPPHIARRVIQPEIIVSSTARVTSPAQILPTTLQPPAPIFPAQTTTQQPASATTFLQAPKATETNAFLTVGQLANTITPTSLSFVPPASTLLSNAKAGDVQAQFIGTTNSAVPVLQLNTAETPTVFNSVYSQSNPAPSALQFSLFYGALDGIPSGATLQITPQTLTPIQTTHSTIPPLPQEASAAPILAPIFLNTEGWPLLNDIYQSASQAAPQAAQVLSNITPSPSNPAQIMPAALFFLAAVRGGDLGQWLGSRASDLLKGAGKTDLLSSLKSESGALNRLASDPTSEWRSLPIPFYHDDHFQKILLHTREEDSANAKERDKGKHVRFIFDLSYDRVGDVQIDGLFREKRLDIILRTEQNFSRSMQMEMRRIYAGAVEQAGVTGELSFQNQLQQWVTIDYKKEAFGGEA